MTIKIGFTGTLAGMTLAQRNAIVEELDKLFSVLETFEFHHGMAEGADQQFHELIRLGPTDRLEIVGHPGTTKNGFAWRRGEFDLDDPLFTVLEAKGYHDRNHDIVDVLCYPKNGSDELWATPRDFDKRVGNMKMWEPKRSGTWSTLRYGEATGKGVRIFWPDGTQELSHGLPKTRKGGKK